MKIFVKTRFNAALEKFEKYGEGMYILHLPFEEDEDSLTIVKTLLSRNLGIPLSQIQFKGRHNFTKDLVFEIQ